MYRWMKKCEASILVFQITSEFEQLSWNHVKIDLASSYFLIQYGISFFDFICFKRFFLAFQPHWFLWLVLMHDSHSSSIKLPGNFPLFCILSPRYSVAGLLLFILFREALWQFHFRSHTDIKKFTVSLCFCDFIAFITTWFYCTFAFNIHILSVENKFQQKVNFVSSCLIRLYSPSPFDVSQLRNRYSCFLFLDLDLFLALSLHSHFDLHSLHVVLSKYFLPSWY